MFFARRATSNHYRAFICKKIDPVSRLNSWAASSALRQRCLPGIILQESYKHPKPWANILIFEPSIRLRCKDPESQATRPQKVHQDAWSKNTLKTPKFYSKFKFGPCPRQPNLSTSSMSQGGPCGISRETNYLQFHGSPHQLLIFLLGAVSSISICFSYLSVYIRSDFEYGGIRDSRQWEM